MRRINIKPVSTHYYFYHTTTLGSILDFFRTNLGANIVAIIIQGLSAFFHQTCWLCSRMKKPARLLLEAWMHERMSGLNSGR